MFFMPTSVATRQATVTGAFEDAVTRVHNRMPSDSGSPDATPCRKGANRGSGSAHAGRTTRPVAAAAPAACSKVRREIEVTPDNLGDALVDRRLLLVRQG